MRELQDSRSCRQSCWETEGLGFVRQKEHQGSPAEPAVERGDASAAPPDWKSAHSPPPPPPGATLRLPLAVTNASQSSPLEAALRQAHPFK